jgi:hypothetical protein
MSDFSYQVEDLHRRLPELCELIGVSCSMRVYEEFQRRKIHSRPHESISPDYIKERDETLYQDLLETAGAFGYDLGIAAW